MLTTTLRGQANIMMRKVTFHLFHDNDNGRKEYVTGSIMHRTQGNRRDQFNENIDESFSCNNEENIQQQLPSSHLQQCCEHSQQLYQYSYENSLLSLLNCNCRENERKQKSYYENEGNEYDNNNNNNVRPISIQQMKENGNWIES